MTDEQYKLLPDWREGDTQTLPALLGLCQGDEEREQTRMLVDHWLRLRKKWKDSEEQDR